MSQQLLKGICIILWGMGSHINNITCFSAYHLADVSSVVQSVFVPHLLSPASRFFTRFQLSSQSYTNFYCSVQLIPHLITETLLCVFRLIAITFLLLSSYQQKR